MLNWPNLSAASFLSHPLNAFQARRLAPALLAMVIASAWAFPAAAQQSQPIEEVVVTGYRQSILNAIDAKRLGDTVSETLSADDLGALPDVSMADALTRLPGISAVRTGGQAGEINIRGMAGGFVFTTLNGREQVSPSGSRSIEFDQYPSELISTASVYKSPKASLIEGGVAGVSYLGGSANAGGTESGGTVTWKLSPASRPSRAFSSPVMMLLAPCR